MPYTEMETRILTQLNHVRTVATLAGTKADKAAQSLVRRGLLSQQPIEPWPQPNRYTLKS